MRRLTAITVSLLVLSACSGGSEDAEETVEAPTPTTTSDDGDLFTESDAISDSDGASDGDAENAATTTVATETTVVDSEASNDGGESPEDDDDGGSADGGSTDGAAADGSTGADATTIGGDDSNAAADGGSDGSGATATGGSDDGDTGSDGTTSGGSDDGSNGADSTTAGADGTTVTASRLDRSILLDADEFGASGLGSDWEIEIVIEPAATGVSDAPCGLDRVLAVDQLYADATNQTGEEFEQILAPGVGADAVGLVRGLADCSEIVSQLGSDGGLVDVTSPTGPALGFSISDDAGDERLNWFGGDVDGIAVLVFHVGPQDRSAAVQAAFEQLLLDVAAGV